MVIAPRAGGGVSFAPSSGTNSPFGNSGFNMSNSGGMTTMRNDSVADVSSGGILLNFTEIQRRLVGVDKLTGIAPRWLTLSRITRPDNSSINSTAIALVIDFARESQIGLGRAWQHPKLQKGEAHVSAVALRRIGIQANAGQNITMVIDLLGFAAQTLGLDGSNTGKLLRQLLMQTLAGGATGAAGGGSGAADGGLNATALIDQFGNFSLAGLLDRINSASGQQFTLDALVRYVYGAFGATPPSNVDFSRPIIDLAFDYISDALVIRRNLTVIDALDSPSGKFPKALGNVILLDKRYRLN